MTDSVFWHNGVVLDQGLPVLMGMPGAAGVDGVPVQGQPLCFGQGSHMDWTGPILAGQQIPLHARLTLP